MTSRSEFDRHLDIKKQSWPEALTIGGVRYVIVSVPSEKPRGDKGYRLLLDPAWGQARVEEEP